MGMYTEFIFGCELSKNTPKLCVDALDYVINGNKKPEEYLASYKLEDAIKRESSEEDINKFADEYDFWMLFKCCSYYFGANNPTYAFKYDHISDSYHISTRADLKNYDGQIDKFLEYIRPYVIHASGPLDVYAYVQYEEANYPTIYSLRHGKEEFCDPRIDAKYRKEITEYFKSAENFYNEMCPEYVLNKEDLQNDTPCIKNYIDAAYAYAKKKFAATNNAYGKGYSEAVSRMSDEVMNLIKEFTNADGEFTDDATDFVEMLKEIVDTYSRGIRA